MLQDLVLRLALIEGKTSTVRLSNRLAIGPVLMSKIVEEMRDRKLFEVISIEGRDYILQLTDEGRRQAQERMTLCRYVGAAPVPLYAYTDMIQRQHAEPRYDLQTLREAFADLVIADSAALPDRASGDGSRGHVPLRPAGHRQIQHRRAPQPRADRRRLRPDAVEVDSQIVTVFDPVVHRPLPDQPPDLDPRWVLCERPFVIVGGELTVDQLDLTYEQGNGVYLAPLQMQANNGVLVIDDFGRQALSPRSAAQPLDRPARPPGRLPEPSTTA